MEFFMIKRLEKNVDCYKDYYQNSKNNIMRKVNDDLENKETPKKDSSIIKVPIDRRVYYGLKMLFKEKIKAFEMMDIICRAYIENNDPDILNIVDNDKK